MKSLAAALCHALGWPALGLTGAARLGTRQRPWLLELVDIWSPYLLAAFPVLLGKAVLARSRGLALLASLGSGVWLSLVCRAYARGVTGDCHPDIRVLSGNVLGWNERPAGLVEIIRQHDPDVIALQELRHEFIAGLVEAIGKRYPYQAFEPHERFSGSGILSRFPFELYEPLKLSEGGHICQRARIRASDRLISLYSLHLQTPLEMKPRPGQVPNFWLLPRPENRRDQEIEKLLAMVSSVEEPLLVVGDFNAAAWTRPYRRLALCLRDSFVEAGRGFGHTWPQPGILRGLPLPALIRIDYIWYRGGLAPANVRTVGLPGSDHRGLLADFTFT